MKIFLKQRLLALTVLSFTAIYLQGCSSLGTTVEPRESYLAQVFYGTDRALLESGDSVDRYGLERGEVSYGLARLEVWPDTVDTESTQASETLLESTRPVQADEFFETLKNPALPGRAGEVFLFIHGFNRDFITTAQNTMQISDGIGFQGRTVFWSWPSQNSSSSYLSDRTSLRWSEKHLAQFITDLVEKGDTRHLTLVAHSLGSEGLTQALVGIIGVEKLARWNVIENLVLMAPDIDLAIFQRDIVPGLIAADIATTVYASAADWALITSTAVNGYPRAGDSSLGVFTFEGIDTIDATLAKTSFWGHSYYRRSSPVIDDLRRLIVKREPISTRTGLIRIDNDGNVYWKLE